MEQLLQSSAGKAYTSARLRGGLNPKAFSTGPATALLPKEILWAGQPSC